MHDTQQNDQWNSLIALYDAPPPRVSFEFFPPKSVEMETTLWQAIAKLAPLQPEFISVTYGAGGSTRSRTHQTVKRIIKDTSIAPAAHLTCVGASKKEINEVAQEYWDSGVRHIVALRGDMPDNAPYQPHPDGYRYADELVVGLKNIADFEISVAAYPETHPTARSAADDIAHLKRKLDAGATRAITQYFFDVETYLYFRDACHKAGIVADIVPGIMPIGNFAQAKRFSAMCGTSIPDWLARLFTGLDDDPERRNYVALYVACEQCRLLRKEGVEQFHFYTLNRARFTRAICHVLGISETI